MSNSPYTPDPYSTARNTPYMGTDASVAADQDQPGYAPAGTTYAVDEPRTGEPSTAEVAKGEAAQVKDTALDAGKSVAGTAKAEAATVAAEAGHQARSLLSTAGSELTAQASTQQSHLATLLQGYADELGGMARGSSQSGQLTDLAHQAAQKGSDIARWLDEKEPADVLEEVRRFARRRPVAFLALCGLAGVVAGRVTRGAVAANTRVDSPRSEPVTAGEPRSITGGGPDFVAAEATPGYPTESTYGSYTDAATSQGFVGETENVDVVDDQVYSDTQRGGSIR